jgi:carbonic anhydrase
MGMLDEILTHNAQYVATRQYESLQTDKFPDKGLAILACMDARLVELLPQALGIRNGDGNLIKNAGALVTAPWGSVMRSLLVAVYALRAEEICVIAHYDCGMSTIDPADILAQARQRGISADVIRTLRVSGIDLDGFLKGFANVEESVRNTCTLVRQHPLLPRDVPVHGLIIDPSTGRLDTIVNGYAVMHAENSTEA